MKITIALDCFNKESTIADVVRSWVSTLSGQHEVELMVCFDALNDHSDFEVSSLMWEFPNVAYKALYADDVFEIKADNMMLAEATGDVIVFVQDDNFQYDANWDDTLAKVYQWAEIPNPTHLIGAISLLSGVRMHKDFALDRMECFRPHKDERAWVHGINKDAYPLAVYQVDVVNRPFAVRVSVLRFYGGLDEGYCPMDYDDADLSFKLLRDGYTNLYIPFDVLNLCSKKDTLSQGQIAENYMRGERIARERWAGFIAARESSVRLLWKLEATDAGLSL